MIRCNMLSRSTHIFSIYSLIQICDNVDVLRTRNSELSQNKQTNVQHFIIIIIIL